MSKAFATVDDIVTLWRPLTTAEAERAEAILPLISDVLRQAATNAGKDLDRMILESDALKSTAKLVAVDVVSRILRQNTTGEAMSQESQSAIGYNWQGTYAIPGGGMANAIMRNDLKRLGITRQTLKVVELYDPGRDNNPPGQNSCGGGRF